MKNQANEMASLDWLFPVIQEELSAINNSEDAAINAASTRYHQISGALVMVKLPILAVLANMLSVLSDKEGIKNLTAIDQKQLQFGHELLQLELSQVNQRGSYQKTLVIKTAERLEAIFRQHQQSWPASAKLWLTQTPSRNLAQQEPDIPNQSLSIAVPSLAKTLTLQPDQLQKLLSVWRQQLKKVMALKEESRHQAALLAPLAKVSQYLWHASANDHQQLWYLADVWLQNLAQNLSTAQDNLQSVPQTKDYAAILVKLEHVLHDYCHSNDKVTQSLNADDVEGLISEIYLQLRLLSALNDAACQVLAPLSNSSAAESAFLPRILGKIEAVIFGLDDPAAQLLPMGQIKRQLGLRGWSFYEAQADDILSQLEDLTKASNKAESDLGWQVERQLQELYSAIYNTDQAIKNKIGTATSFSPKPAPSDHFDFDFNDDALRQLRIAVEDVKQHFSDYVQRQQPYLLPPIEAFFDIGDAFDDMGLESIRPLTDKLGELIANLGKQEVKAITWPLTQALADSLSAIELILDHLAQQVFDQGLLEKAVSQVDHADTLFQQLLNQPMEYSTDHLKGETPQIGEMSPDSFEKDRSVTRYDDEGEIAPIATVTEPAKNDIITDELDNVSASALAEDNKAEIDAASHHDLSSVSPELKAIQEALPDDDFTMDSEIREIFIEEAQEVIEELTDLLPIWEQDPEDLSALKDIRRSFHTLKGSGRMVGAWRVGEAAWAIEQLLNRVLDHTISPSLEVVDLVSQTLSKLPQLIADFDAERVSKINPAVIMLQSQNLLANKPLNSGFDLGLDLVLNAQESLANDSPTIDSPTVETAETETAENDSQIRAADAENSPVAASTDSKALPLASSPALPAVLKTILNDLNLPDDLQEADPDIKEIFIEEADEVLAEIAPLFQQWQPHFEDLAPLKDIRRGFHTLKGSGRMVGACYSSELAWAIETMLNRLLDHSITPSADIVALVGDVIDLYPALIEVFANNGKTEDYPSQIPLLIACAQALSKPYNDDFSYQQVIQETGQVAAPVVELAAHSTASDYVDDSVDGNVTNSFNISFNNSAPTDKILQACHSAQEIISEALAEIPSQSAEEQAFAAIFIDEAYDLLSQIDDFVQSNKNADFVEVSDDVVRAFHTLRAASGSSALAAISKVSAAIEQSLEQLQQQDALMDAQHLQAIAQSVEMIDSYLDAYRQDQLPLISAVPNQNSTDLITLQSMLDHPSKSVLTDSRFSVAELLKIGIDALLDAECYLRHSLSESSTEQTQFYITEQQKQIAKLAQATASSSKFSQVLAALAHAYDYLYHNVAAARDNELQSLLLSGHDQLVGLFDALAGSMSLKVDDQVIAELQALGDKSYQENNALTAEALSDDDKNDGQNEDQNDKSLIARNDAKTDSEAGFEADAQSQTESRSVDTIQADELSLEVIDTDIELLEIFLEEAQELDNAIAQTFGHWRADKADIAALKILQRHLHTIKGGARMAGIHSIGDLTHEAESVYEAFVNERRAPTDQWLDIMQTVQDTLSLQIDYVVRYRESFFAADLIDQLQHFLQADELPKKVTLVLPALQNHLQSDDPEESLEVTESAGGVNLDQLIAESWGDNAPDPDILEVFLEEADELIVSSNKYLQLFLNNISDLVALQALQRNLHTIKGGARMVAANGVADLAHQMETVYEELAIRRRPATKMVAQLLEACHDWLADAIFILKHHLNPPTPKALIDALIQFSKNPDSLSQIPQQSLQNELSAVLAARAKQEAVRGAFDISQMPSMSGSFEAQEQSSSNEMIRISSTLIERMINLSGESAINRARIDMGMSSLTNSIEEMGATIQRLADQLRRMEIELEAQILAQIDDADLIDSEGFDPLEMDQYSSLNQLSKSLSESASDLGDINSTLLEKTRDSENLLLQLSRTQTELQDGLMNSRMVPFSRLTPRLERIVRQTANELNKSVELSLINADDEMDRTILERITSPLEHMLRNAVDHGIESPQERLNLGKDRSGQISLEVIREGSEVVIHLTDDGRGINVEAVRQKAISQGLIDANDKSLSDIDVMQYIFNAGLTTTNQVTQISGRGVGMDVVISEIKQLGGLVSVTSKPNQGSRFTLRVPLTVAVSDALVVRASDRYYAIPLVQIERVVRVQPDKLFEYYQSNRATMRIEDTDYRVHYLNEILTGSRLNELIVSTNSSLPVIIVKNRAGQNLALQVDQIAGSRIEVVVKPLGRQLSHLAGISAATIMGDGSVMLILDLLALLRNAAVIKDTKQVGRQQAPKATKKSDQPTILVVDDSVTVRKVTSRFLERQGLSAVVAKDGIDAIDILQSLTPDLILLDIEMPRMDGFEVATQIRHDRRLKHIPIIMITSRTGEKHRERAFEIGVNDYMGKPFQENQLLDKIQALLGISLGEVHDG